MRAGAALLLIALPVLLEGPAAPPAAAQLPRGMVRIEAGSFRPLYASQAQKSARVHSFAIDTVPVSVAAFLKFVQRHPAWAPESARAEWVDADYLNDVTSDTEAARRPISSVSWFAAAAYCQARGARLPTTHEWEYLARADEHDRSAGDKPGFQQRALELALAGHPATFRIGAGLRNVWGVRDLHGGLLEWTADYQGQPSSQTHPAHDHDGPSTCAAGTVQTGDASDYAAFLRYAFRAAATPRTTALNVGFRCAASLPPASARRY